MITVRLDTREAVKALEKLSTQLPSQLRNGLNRAARAARTEFNQLAVKEIGVPRGKLKMLASKEFIAARPEDLRAIFKPTSKTVNLAATGTVRWNGKGSPLTASTHVLTGGPSSRLVSPHGELLGGLAWHRVKHGSGTHRKGLKQLKTTSPRTIMGQDGNPLRVAWARKAEERLIAEIPASIQEAARRSGFE